MTWRTPSPPARSIRANCTKTGVIDAVIEDARAWYGPAMGRRQTGGRVRTNAPARHIPRLFRRIAPRARRIEEHDQQSDRPIRRFRGTTTRDTYGNEPLTRYNGDLVIPEETSYEIVVLKGIAVHFVMEPGEREPMHGEEQRIVGDLVGRVHGGQSQNRPARWRTCSSTIGARPADDGERLRVAIDQVASLTDTSAPDPSLPSLLTRIPPLRAKRFISAA